MFKMLKRVLLSRTFPLLLLVASSEAMAAGTDTLTHHAGGEIAYEVTSNGLSRITFQGRTLAARRLTRGAVKS
jgi:hypothetical protein